MTQPYKEVHLKEGEIVTITPDMIIGDVLAAYPEAKKVLDDIGIHCTSCYAMMYDSIQEGAELHRLDPQKLCNAINKTLKEQRKQ